MKVLMFLFLMHFLLIWHSDLLTDTNEQSLDNSSDKSKGTAIYTENEFISFLRDLNKEYRDMRIISPKGEFESTAEYNVRLQNAINESSKIEKYIKLPIGKWVPIEYDADREIFYFFLPNVAGSLHSDHGLSMYQFSKEFDIVSKLRILTVFFMINYYSHPILKRTYNYLGEVYSDEWVNWHPSYEETWATRLRAEGEKFNFIFSSIKVPRKIAPDTKEKLINSFLILKIKNKGFPKNTLDKRNRLISIVFGFDIIKIDIWDENNKSLNIL